MPKIALIGHSGSGKTSIINKIGVDECDMDLDPLFPITMSPPCEKMLRWVQEKNSCFFAISVHANMLKELAAIKSMPWYEKEIKDSVLFVYIHQTKEQLKDNLSKNAANGKLRSVDHQMDVLKGYDDLHLILKNASDTIIDVSGKNIDELAKEIREMAG